VEVNKGTSAAQKEPRGSRKEQREYPTSLREGTLDHRLSPRSAAMRYLAFPNAREAENLEKTREKPGIFLELAGRDR
jgi:hypothetical protein